MNLIIFVIMGLILFGGIIGIVWVMQEEQVQEEFIRLCTEGLDDVKKSISAVQSQNVELCKEIKDPDEELFCRAEVLKKEDICDALTYKQSVAFCKAIVQKDQEKCTGNKECLAYVTQDTRYCDMLDATNRNECKAIVLKDPSFLKEKDCEQASKVFRAT